AAGVGSRYRDDLGIKQRLLTMKWHGLILSVAGTVAVTILTLGFALEYNLPFSGRDGAPIDVGWAVAPSLPGTLALVLLTGLIAGNLWADRLLPWDALTAVLLDRFSFRLAYFPLLAAPAYLLAAPILAWLTNAKVGISTIVPGGPLGYTGFGVCVLGY